MQSFLFSRVGVHNLSHIIPASYQDYQHLGISYFLAVWKKQRTTYPEGLRGADSILELQEKQVLLVINTRTFEFLYYSYNVSICSFVCLSWKFSQLLVSCVDNAPVIGTYPNQQFQCVWGGGVLTLRCLIIFAVILLCCEYLKYVLCDPK